MIYHITTEKEWAACRDQPDYAPAAFEKDGFIHTSRLHQVEGVLQRYYADRSDLLLLKINERRISANLIYEPSTNKELFPHIYGKLNKSAIAEVLDHFTMEKLAALMADH